MELADFAPEFYEVKVKKGQVLRVRGLSLLDFSILIRGNFAELEKAFEIYKRAQSERKTVEQTLMLIISDAPAVVAHLIALAAGAGEQADRALLLSFPAQCDALMNILRLTFEDVGGIKNFAAMLLNLAATLGVKMPETLTKLMAPIATTLQ